MTRFTQFIKKVKDEGEQGFTLIELMVVVLIIGILMAIAIPTFLGAKNSANAKAAQANVRNVFTDEAADYSNNQLYDGTLADLTAQEANIPIAGTPGAGTAWTANTVYVSTGTANGTAGAAVILGSLGKDNKCYYIEAVQGAAYYGIGAYASNACTAPATWDSSWGGTAASPAPASVTAVTAAA